MVDMESRRRIRLFLSGALLGTVVFLLIFGISAVDPINDSFLRGGFVEKDVQQHYAGWLFYRRSAQRFPLCIAQDINAPNGLSIVYTDSIPLFAAFFRAFENLLPHTFQYFSLFTLLCYALQGGFGALLCGLFTDDAIRPLFGSLFFSASPVLLERAFRHTSLGAQFLVLAALYYYFLSRREQRFCYPLLFLFNIAAAGIHAYFLPMTYSITLAMLLNYVKKTRHWRGPALYLGLNLAGSVSAMWALGYFYGSASSGGQALYGYFAMNLNALWNPCGINGVDYSLFLPVQNQVNGNYDAFAYLGFGALLALPCALVILRHRVKEHLPLCAVCLILTMFSISHVITANGATLIALPLSEKLIRFFSIFRSGGRLFWPVYYLLMLSAFVGLCRVAHSRLLVAAAVFLQLLDLSPAFLERHQEMSAAQTVSAFSSSLTSDFWQQAADRYEHLFSMDGIQDDALHLALYAADNAMTTNDPFAARSDETALAAQRQAAREELQNGILREDTLYLFKDEGAFLQCVETVRDLAWCGEVRGGEENVWFVIAPGLYSQTFDAKCRPYNDEYPLRLADYTDALWNRGVLDSTKQTVCFADSPFARSKLENAAWLCSDGKRYRITKFDDHDPGWLMLTLDIEDATVLWEKELRTQ